MWIFPVGGRHPYASHQIAALASIPLWHRDDEPFVPEAVAVEPCRLCLTPTRLRLLWQVLQSHIRHGPHAGRLGPAQLRLVRTRDPLGARSAFITLEVDAERWAHVLGLLRYRVLVGREPILRFVRLMWVDVALREPLLVA